MATRYTALGQDLWRTAVVAFGTVVSSGLPAVNIAALDGADTAACWQALAGAFEAFLLGPPAQEPGPAAGAPDACCLPMQGLHCCATATSEPCCRAMYERVRHPLDRRCWACGPAASALAVDASKTGATQGVLACAAPPASRADTRWWGTLPSLCSKPEVLPRPADHAAEQLPGLPAQLAHAPSANGHDDTVLTVRRRTVSTPADPAAQAEDAAAVDDANLEASVLDALTGTALTCEPPRRPPAWRGCQTCTRPTCC